MISNDTDPGNSTLDFNKAPGTCPAPQQGDISNFHRDPRMAWGPRCHAPCFCWVAPRSIKFLLVQLISEPISPLLIVFCSTSGLQNFLLFHIGSIYIYWTCYSFAFRTSGSRSTYPSGTDRLLCSAILRASRISVGKRSAQARAAAAPPCPSKTAKRHSGGFGVSKGFSGNEGPLTSSGKSSNKPGKPAALILGAGPSGKPLQSITCTSSFWGLGPWALQAAHSAHGPLDASKEMFPLAFPLTAFPFETFPSAPISCHSAVANVLVFESVGPPVMQCLDWRLLRLKNTSWHVGLRDQNRICKCIGCPILGVLLHTSEFIYWLESTPCANRAPLSKDIESGVIQVACNWCLLYFSYKKLEQF